MSHELDFTKGRAAIAYRGDTPWHGYGEEMEPDMTQEQWLHAAGMDYEVLEQPISFKRPSDIPTMTPHYQAIEGKKALVRSDTYDVLSVVSDQYKVVQPDEVLAFFKTLVDEQGFEMHTAGVLADGKRVWALAQTGLEYSIDGKDPLAAYLLLATSYDGKFSTTAQFTSIRVVCNNTLSWSLNAGENQTNGIVKIPHVSEFVPSFVKDELGLLEGGWDEFTKDITALSKIRISDREALDFFLYVLNTTEEEVLQGAQLINMKKLISFYESAPGATLVTAKGTLWGAVNAVTFLCDHARRARNAGMRFNSTSFGASARLKARAFQQAKFLAGIEA